MHAESVRQDLQVSLLHHILCVNCFEPCAWLVSQVRQHQSLLLYSTALDAGLNFQLFRIVRDTPGEADVEIVPHGRAIFLVLFRFCRISSCFTCFICMCIHTREWLSCLRLPGYIYMCEYDAARHKSCRRLCSYSTRTYLCKVISGNFEHTMKNTEGHTK